MKKVCIVGYGAIGPVHAKALEGVKQAELYAVCDIDAERCRACAELYSVKEYVDFDEMLQDEQIDSVHICTPHYLHFEMVRKVLAAGKDVVVEKPVTMTREQFEMLKTLEGAERVCVVLQNRTNPCVEKMKELVESKEFGKVLGAKGILTWYRSKEYYDSEEWRGKWATEGGGVLINQAVHTLDYFSYLIGNVLNVKANMCNYSLEKVIEVEDTFTARLGFENGTTGIFFATNGYHENSAPYFEIAFEKEHVRYQDQKLWVNGNVVEEDAHPSIGKAYWGSGHGKLFKLYYDEQKYFGIADVQNTMETMFAMYASANSSGREIKL